MDDFSHDLFLVMDFHSEVFREVCLHLASWPFLETSECLFVALFGGRAWKSFAYDCQPTKQANKSLLNSLHTHTCWCLRELELRLSRHVKAALGPDCLSLLDLTPDVQLETDGLLVATRRHP